MFLKKHLLYIFINNLMKSKEAKNAWEKTVR